MGIEIFRDSKQEWRFRIRANNGKILCHSEGYKEKRKAMNGLQAVDKAFGETLIPEDVKIIE